MSKKKSQKVNVPRKVKEDLKNDSSNVENTKIEFWKKIRYFKYFLL